MVVAAGDAFGNPGGPINGRAAQAGDGAWLAPVTPESSNVLGNALVMSTDNGGAQAWLRTTAQTFESWQLTIAARTPGRSPGYDYIDLVITMAQTNANGDLTSTNGEWLLRQAENKFRCGGRQLDQRADFSAWNEMPLTIAGWTDKSTGQFRTYVNGTEFKTSALPGGLGDVNTLLIYTAGDWGSYAATLTFDDVSLFSGAPEAPAADEWTLRTTFR